jgi:hypothetical protein
MIYCASYELTVTRIAAASNIEHEGASSSASFTAVSAASKHTAVSRSDFRAVSASFGGLAKLMLVYEPAGNS